MREQTLAQSDIASKIHVRSFSTQSVESGRPSGGFRVLTAAKEYDCGRGLNVDFTRVQVPHESQHLAYLESPER
jgi:hypothetical protein